MFLDGREFVLHPMLFAYEDWEQIIEFLIETFKHLAAAASIYKEEVKAITLSECMDTFMTDAVSKNLKIVDEISRHLDLNHKPHHTLA